ncbi:hypothetical protein L6164_007114 [Bauhinia variegata]|uniref:Uncharacterized protein n=1 Tax=Bauhinia variegata TaxID=167791 RepID=A0ACB9PYL7_BAUVA|nr:hypothetical protein L6164_007114 [Bauhinia variegata]
MPPNTNNLSHYCPCMNDWLQLTRVIIKEQSIAKMHQNQLVSLLESLVYLLTAIALEPTSMQNESNLLFSLIESIVFSTYSITSQDSSIAKHASTAILSRLESMVYLLTG